MSVKWLTIVLLCCFKSTVDGIFSIDGSCKLDVLFVLLIEIIIDWFGVCVVFCVVVVVACVFVVVDVNIDDIADAVVVTGVDVDDDDNGGCGGGANVVITDCGAGDGGDVVNTWLIVAAAGMFICSTIL